MKVLEAAASKFGFKLDTEYDFGGERYKRTGENLPDSALEDLRQHQAILLGAIGHPDVKPGILEKGILLRLRFASTSTSTCARCACTRAWKPRSRTRPRGDRLRRGPRELRRHLHRHRRHLDEGHAARSRRPEHGLQPSPGGALPALGVRIRPQARQEGPRHRRRQHPRPGRQDQRPDLRLRPLGARLPRNRRGRTTRTSSATTTTSTPPACGWSRARSGSTCW
jgi:hypothetical protein